MRFHIVGTQEVLISHSGLVLAGALLQATQLKRRLDRVKLEGGGKPEISHGDNGLSMIGLLCMGKSDFEAINAFEAESDEFFRLALGLGRVPSEPTLRQRLDLLGVHDAAATTAAESRVRTILLEESAQMVRRHAPKLTACFKDWIPLDSDVSPFDNSNTRKEHVSYTYKGMDGYAPNFAYLGQEGYMINCELRPGSQHCQCGTPAFLDETLELARRITQAKLLVRMDAGNDDIENVRVLRQKGHGPVDWIIKRNLRKESPAEWFEEACAHGVSVDGRPGKEVWIGDAWRERDGKVERVVVEAIRAHDDGGRPGPAGAGAGDQHILDQPETLESQRPASGRALPRPRHERAVPQRVQDGHGHRAAAERQVRDQRPGVGMRAGGVQRPAVVRAGVAAAGQEDAG